MSFFPPSFIPYLQGRGWTITSVSRKDELYHLTGRAVDALPPGFRSGVSYAAEPLYLNREVVKRVKSITKRFKIRALIEEGHVHFFVPFNSLSSKTVQAFVKGDSHESS